MKTLVFLLIISFVVGPAFGATRFYLPSTGIAQVSPAFSASWNLTTAADRIRMYNAHYRINSAMTAKTATGDNTTPQSILNRQYVSDPIAGQTITGTVKGQLLGNENNVGFDGVSAVLIRVVSNDGATVRGTLLALTYPVLAGNEYLVSTDENRYTPVSTALTSVAAQNGDRIVVEVGFYCYSKNSKIGSQTFGDNNASDLPEDQTTQTQNNPWIEFSADIQFPRSNLID